MKVFYSDTNGGSGLKGNLRFNTHPLITVIKGLGLITLLFVEIRKLDGSGMSAAFTNSFVGIVPHLVRLPHLQV
jgi:hypothetical protein